LILALLAWTHAVRYWHILILATLIGVANALDMPARQSFVIELVGRDDLLNAIALNSAAFNAARLVGPALGGLLIARYGVGIAFCLHGVPYGPGIAALLAMATGGLPRGPRAAFRTEIADGLRYAAGEPRVALLLGLVVAVSVFVLNHNVVVPLLARDVLRQEVEGFGYLMAALGAGALAAAGGLAQFGRRRPPVPVLGLAAG